MIMKSEGEKIKFVVSPPRDKKYAIVAYSQFIQDMINIIPDDVLPGVIRGLIDLCYAGNN